MQRQVGADLEDLERVVRPEHMVDDQHTLAVNGADPHRLAASHRQVVRPGQGAAAKLVHIQVDVAQAKQRAAQLVLAAVGILLDEALLLKRPQKPVHGALREPQPVAQLGHPEPARAAGEGAQDGGGTLDRLDCHATSLIVVVEPRSTL